MKKKKLILLLIIILIGTTLLEGYYLLKERKLKKNIKQDLNITSMISLDNLEAQVYSDFYLIETEKGITIYNFENQELFQCNEKYTSYKVLNNNILFKNGNHLKILSLTGEVLLEGEENFVELNSEDYFFLNDKLYNKELKEIYTLPAEKIDQFSSYVVINNILFLFFDNGENEVIDLVAKEVLAKSFKSYFSFESLNETPSYIALSYDGTYKIVDTITRKLILDDVIINEGNILKNKDGTYYIYNNKIYQNHTYINDYYMDFTNCQAGGKLLNKENNVIIDICSLYYEEPFKDIFIGYVENSSFLKIKSKIIYADNFLKVGQYIMSYSSKNDQNNIIIYDEYGKVIKENMEIRYLSDNLYEGYDLINTKSYL